MTITDNIPFSELKEKRKQDKTNTIVLITETEPETEVQDSNGEEDKVPFSELKEQSKQDKTNTIVLITETEPETEARVTEEANSWRLGRSRARFFYRHEFRWRCSYYKRTSWQLSKCQIHIGRTYGEIGNHQAFDLHPYAFSS